MENMYLDLERMNRYKDGDYTFYPPNEFNSLYESSNSNDEFSEEKFPTEWEAFIKDISGITPLPNIVTPSVIHSIPISLN